MSVSDSQDLDSTIVYMNGRKITIGNVKKSYAKLSFLSKTSAMNIVNILVRSKEPLTRELIAKKANLSVGYTIDLLNNLIQFVYAVSFFIGKRKVLFYAITAKGYDALASKTEKEE